MKNHLKESNPKDGGLKIWYGIGAIFVLAFFLTGPSGVAAGGNVSIFVSIVPQKYFVQQIGKELVDVQAMTPPGASPATYEPKPKQMAALVNAKIYYAIGVPFEKVWLARIAAANPKMKVIHTDSGIQKIPMQTYRHNEKSNHHQHGILDPHIWTSPQLGKMQAGHILAALVQVDPMHKSIYQVNYEKFIKKLSQIDAEFKEIFSEKQGTEFIVFHPAWGYFAQAYGLRQIPIEIEGKQPKPAQLKKLIAYARKRRIKVIFVQPQFSAKSAQTIARAIDGHVVSADPLAPNWEENLRQLAAKFKTALK